MVTTTSAGRDFRALLAVRVSVTTQVAGGARVVRVGAAGLVDGTGRCRRRTAAEEEAQDAHGIGDDDTSVVVWLAKKVRRAKKPKNSVDWQNSA